MPDAAAAVESVTGRAEAGYWRVAVAGASRLVGRYPLYKMCVDAAVATTDNVNVQNEASGRRLFPELEWLGLRSIEQLDPPAADDNAGHYTDPPSEATTAAITRGRQTLAVRIQRPLYEIPHVSERRSHFEIPPLRYGFNRPHS